MVREAHLPQLNQILDLVRDVLDDEQKKYFIVIDRLDEAWVDDSLRYKLIMALIDTVKEFRRVPNAKIVVALRLDLLQRVYKNARAAGFQEEKLQSLYLRIAWSRSELAGLVDRRVNHVFRDRYAKNKTLSSRDIMVQSRRDAAPLDYILDRTFLRPRDAICFFNDCIVAAQGRAKIAMKDVRTAEEAYSKGRLGSLGDEWYAKFPNLVLFAKAILAGAKPQGDPFQIRSEAELFESCASLQARNLPRDDFSDVCDAFLELKRPSNDMVRAACSILYRVGLIGAKLIAGESFSWYATDGKRLNASEFKPGSTIQVHPMFWRALAIPVRE